jgi:hypothetical protein
MKTVVMWSYSDGSREININGIEPELFEKLRSVFDTTEGPTDCTGRINIDKNTTIIFSKTTERMKLKKV